MGAPCGSQYSGKTMGISLLSPSLVPIPQRVDLIDLEGLTQILPLLPSWRGLLSSSGELGIFLIFWTAGLPGSRARTREQCIALMVGGRFRCPPPSWELMQGSLNLQVARQPPPWPVFILGKAICKHSRTRERWFV